MSKIIDFIENDLKDKELTTIEQMTQVFFIKYKREINVLIEEHLENIGSSVETLSGYDDTDPLFLNSNNQNLAAWVDL